jgi:hypothetical protein
MPGSVHSDLRRMNVLVELIWISNTCMIECLRHDDKCSEQNTISASNNVLRNPVFTTNILIIDRVTSLHINPAHVKSFILETIIKMLDITHHPHHFDASLKGQMALGPHLPLRA